MAGRHLRDGDIVEFTTIPFSDWYYASQPEPVFIVMSKGPGLKRRTIKYDKTIA
jgi:hypothetical protein